MASERNEGEDPAVPTHDYQIANACKARNHAFFAQLGAWDLSGQEIFGPEDERDAACFLPALELYFNGAASLPGGDALVRHRLATLKFGEFEVRGHPQTVVTVEPRAELKFFILEMIKRYIDAPWLDCLLVGVLDYVARSEGQGCCTTARLLNYAIAANDAPLLSVLVDYHSRRSVGQIIGIRKDDILCEKLRLDALIGPLTEALVMKPDYWSWIRPRTRAAVIFPARSGHSFSAVKVARTHVREKANPSALFPTQYLPGDFNDYILSLIGETPDRDRVPSRFRAPFQLDRNATPPERDAQNAKTRKKR